MTQSWRIPVNFEMWTQQIEKRLMRQERRAVVTNASQILGPGAGPYAILVNDWNDEVATFNGIYHSEPGAVNGPDDLLSLVGDYYWLGETFGTEDGYGFQRLTRYRLVPNETGSWSQYRRRFYKENDLYGYTTWEVV